MTTGAEVRVMDFEDGGRNYKPRNAGWKRQENRFGTSGRSAALLTP